jgi:hypothetical protein
LHKLVTRADHIFRCSAKPGRKGGVNAVDEDCRAAVSGGVGELVLLQSYYRHELIAIAEQHLVLIVGER